jgi:ATP-dependent helicase/nuclease subunit B
VEDRSPKQARLDRILSASRPVVLLLGPAGTGKTSAALAMYQRFQSPGKGRCLLLAPNIVSVTRLRRKLLDESAAGVLVSPLVMTFEDLAGRILAAGGDADRTLSAFYRLLLLRRIVNELNAEGKLPVLAAVVDTPGLITALDAAIAEIKRAAIEPESLARAMGNQGGKSADLLAVYRRYQEHLHATGTYDLEGLMWKARDALACADAGLDQFGLGDIATAAVDGFTDFTPTQLSIIQLLSRRLERVLITLPHGRDGRERMWRWANRTLENVRRAFGNELQEAFLDGSGQDDAAAAGNGGLRVLWDKVFDFDASSCDIPPGLSVVTGFNLESEVAAVAGRVKRLLLDGAPAGSIAVLARPMEAYRPGIERIFGEYELPVSPAPTTLATHPIVRFIFDVAGLGPDFASRDVLRVIKNSYFRPQALGPYDPSTVAAAEALVRQANILRGRDRYAQAARRLAEQALRQERPEDDADGRPEAIPYGPEQIETAAEMLERLFELSDSAARSAPAEPSAGQNAATGLVAIIERLELHQAACHDEPELTARDLRALDELEGLLRRLPQPSPPPAMILEALAAASFPQERRQPVVDVLDVLDARALRYRTVFCLGMGEGQFPPKYSESSLITEGDRLAWAKRGAALDSRSDLTAREMLLFYLAITRAEETLTVSFPLSDSSGRPGAPGAFLLSLLEPIGGLDAAEKAGIVQRTPPGQMIPDEGDVASSRDAIVAAVAGRFHEEYDRSGSALAWAAAKATQRISRAASGLFADHRRWQAGPCDQFDGRIGDPDLLARLAERFGPKAVFSATQLGAFGQCPWQFFAKYVLELEPPAEPQRRLEAMTRGLFCHKVLFDTMRRLRDSRGGALAMAEVDRQVLLESLGRAVAAAAAEVEARGPAYPALWKIQRDQMHGQLRDYLLSQQGDKASAARSIHFELAFGPGNQSADSDPASTPQPAHIATPAGGILLGGRIDRVDRVSFQDQRGLLVVDYKTGRLPRKKDILAGRSQQLPLYSAAVAALLGEPSLGGAFHRIGRRNQKGATFFAAFEDSKGGLKPVENYENDLRMVLDRVAQFVQAMRRGQFDLDPTDTDRCISCPYRRICHHSDFRAELKALPDREARP